jgi:hypothetical protein
MRELSLASSSTLCGEVACPGHVGMQGHEMRMTRVCMVCDRVNFISMAE